MPAWAWRVLSDQETCLAFQGLRCEVCYRACPLMGDALVLDFRPNERTGKHAYFLPVVRSDACTGCGMCEHACVLEEAAIKVMPPELARGKLGDHYRFGWSEESEISRDFGPADSAPRRDWKDNTKARAGGARGPLGNRGAMSWVLAHRYLLLRRTLQLRASSCSSGWGRISTWACSRGT